jgi:hypothetical protein
MIFDALHFMHEQLTNVLTPLLRVHYDDAVEYCKKRDQNNILLNGILSCEQSKLDELFVNELDITVKLMSSIGARLNTITESDIDFGICVTDLNNNTFENKLDQEKLEKVSKMLETLRNTREHNFNYDDLSNRYFSHKKIANGIEIEAKIRDCETSRIFLDLHNKIDTTLNEEQIVLFTFAKYILLSDKIAYKYFKKILYESIFYGIKGTFVFPMP